MKKTVTREIMIYMILIIEIMKKMIMKTNMRAMKLMIIKKNNIRNLIAY